MDPALGLKTVEVESCEEDVDEKEDEVDEVDGL